MNKNQSVGARVLKLLAAPGAQPLDKVELSKKLGFSSDRRAELRRVLDELERSGSVVRIRKDRYVLPQEADLVTGTIQIHPNGNAHLLSGKSGVPDLFIASPNTATAMNGDKVVARIMHEGLAEKRGGRGQRGQRGQQEGRVIRILERVNESIVGTLQSSKNFFYVVPDDTRFPADVYVKTARGTAVKPAAIGDKVVVKLGIWESRHINPEGEIVEVLGPASQPGVDVLSIIRKFNLRVDFPAAVLDEADQFGDKVLPDDLRGREDLRGQMIVTIDPDDAKDFDDAVLVEQRGDGWRLGVHIADVSHYVKPGSALDREALERGNSVYLVDRVIPMLPERLSNGLCSLKPQVDRLVQSVFIDFSAQGKIGKVRFGKSVIRSAARLTYREAYALLQKSPSDLIGERLHTAWKLASILRKNRFASGSLDLDFPEVKVRLDDRMRPVALEKIENDISHQLVEEFMLTANEVVARQIKNLLRPSVYRIHEDPDPEKLGEYRDLAASFGYRAGDLTKRREVQKLLAAIRGKPEEYALKLGLLKSLKRAQYATNPVGHYGLAKSDYTHFTSPIRRYADLVIHRVLSSTSNGAPRLKIATKNLPEIAEHISKTERTAADAEKESVKLKKFDFFQTQLNEQRPQSFPAVVVDVRSYGLLVELPDVLITGLIHVSALPNDFYAFDPVRLSFTGRRARRQFRIGDRFEVIVARVDRFKQQIDFVPAS
jgi:ribonuclease R